MNELDKQLKESKEFLLKCAEVDSITIDIILLSIRSAYIQGRIDGLERALNA